MRGFRLLQIKFTHVKDLFPIYTWQYQNMDKMNKYNIRIVFVFSDKNELKLYGYDGKEKWQQYNFSNLHRILTIIEEMPMSKYDKNKSIDVRYEICGLPINTKATGHCFRDTTHHTCCMLGGEARAYADKSGNPIGKASENAFQEYYGFYPSKNTLTPWCTCIGSEVCSYYSQAFQDGTHIKFIHHDGKIVLSSNEKTYKKYSHSTPGVPIL